MRPEYLVIYAIFTVIICFYKAAHSCNKILLRNYKGSTVMTVKDLWNKNNCKNLQHHAVHPIKFIF